jgi:hypothetical protein
MLLRIEAQMALDAAMPQGTSGDQFGIEQGVLGEQAVEEPAVAVCPIHHGRNRQAPRTFWGQERIIHSPIIINK